MKKSRKVLKITLFITFFCLVTLFLSQQKVQAVGVTVTTVQELQEAMGATEYSTINGTTLKITNDFTWTISNDIDMKIPEITIDFNGKEIKVEKSKTNYAISITSGKITLKDSQGEKGGIYCAGHLINVERNAELIIENGQYIAEITDGKDGVIQDDGGIITIENGIFKSMYYSEFFMLCSGKMTINNGNFEMNGILIDASDQHWAGGPEGTQLLIHGGTFSNETLMPLIMLNTRHNRLTAIIDGGVFKSSKGSAISLSSSAWEGETASLTLNGCVIETNSSCLEIHQNLEKFDISIQNCTLKCTYKGIGVPSALHAVYTEKKEFEQQPSSMIKRLIKNYDNEVFWKFTDTNRGGINVNEYTYRELVFKDGQLISAKSLSNEAENNSDNNSESNIQNTPVTPNKNEQNKETEKSTIQGGKTSIEKNDTKLPQTGKETNTFAEWLSIVILLGIFWLGSMLLIEYEKRKMKNK